MVQSVFNPSETPYIGETNKRVAEEALTALTAQEIPESDGAQETKEAFLKKNTGTMELPRFGQTCLFTPAGSCGAGGGR